MSRGGETPFRAGIPRPVLLALTLLPWFFCSCNGDADGSSGGAAIASSSPGGSVTAAADSGTTPEDTPVVLAVLANDTDENGLALSVSSATDPAQGSVVVHPGGTITYTPDPDFFGTDSFRYIASNGSDSAEAEVSVTVTPVNDAPVAGEDETVTTTGDPVDIDVLANDVDVEGDPLSITDVTNPAEGSVVVNGDGTITYTPDATFDQGVDTFDYTVADPSGASDTGTVIVQVFEAGELSFRLFGESPFASFDPETGVGSFTIPLFVEELDLSPGFPHAIESVVLAFELEPGFLTVDDVQLGAGIGADVFEVETDPDTGLTEVTIGITGLGGLLATEPTEVVRVQISTVPAVLAGNAEPVETALVWTSAELIVEGETVTPLLLDLDLELIPTAPGPGFHFLAPGGVVTYDFWTGLGELAEPLFIEEGPASAGFPNAFQSFSMALASDPLFLLPQAIEAGAVIADLNGGLGPDFFSVEILDEGIAALAIFGFDPPVEIPAAGPQQVLTVTYETDPWFLEENGDGAVTTLDWMPLGMPTVFNRVRVGDDKITPQLVPATIVLQPE